MMYTEKKVEANIKSLTCNEAMSFLIPTNLLSFDALNKHAIY